MACSVGVDGMRMLTTTDPFELELLILLTQMARDQKLKWHEHLANCVASEVSKLFGK